MAIKRDKVIANAEKLVAKGKIEPAIKEYERLLADSPGDVNTLNRIGDLWVRINRIDEAVRVFREIADRYSKDGFFLKAIAIYKKINKLDPSRLEVYGELAELYAKQGLAMEAKSQYQILADYYLKQGESHNALGVYQKIAELDPNSINVHVKLADLYSQIGKVTEALSEYDRVGKMLMKRGMLDEALQVFRKALRIDPRNFDLAASLVDTLIEARDFDNAISLLESTLETNPGNARLVALLGRTHLLQNDRASAKRVLEGGVRQNPTDVALRVALCELHLKEGAPDAALNVLGPVADSLASKGDAKAIELLNKIVAVEPLHTPTLAKVVDVYKALKRETNVLASLNSLAEAYIAVQDFDNAGVTLEELIAREPQNAQHKDKLAFVRKSLGSDFGGSRATLEEALSQVETSAEPTDFAMSEPSAEAGTDLGEISGLDFGGQSLEEALPGLTAEPAIDFGELPAEESAPAEGGEHVDFITEHLTEAEVFAKYGLAEKAVEHLEAILGRSPDHLDANERLVRILLDEGLRERACERAAHLLTVYQNVGDDAAFDKWFDELVGKGFAVSPGPPVEVELIEGGAPRRVAPAAAKPVAAPAAPDEPVIEEEAEVTLDFDDLPEVALEEPELTVEEELPAEPVLEQEEEVSLDFEEPEAEEAVEEPVPELPEIEEVAELEFEEEEGEAVELLEEEEEEVVAELDFGEAEAAPLPEIAELPSLELEEPEEEAEKIEEQPAGFPELEEVATLEFEEEAEEREKVAEIAVEEEQILSLDFEEQVVPEPEAMPELEVVPEPEPEPMPEVAPLEVGGELDFGMPEPTALGGPPIEEIGELDFYIEQELFDEARTKVETLMAQFPGSEDLVERMATIEKATAPPPPEAIPAPRFSPEDIESELLAAIPDDDEDIEIHAAAPAPVQEPVIDEGDLFEGEDDFFDLAAELEDELLAEEEPISLAEEEQSLADIFREFKKGVEQQLDSEDYDTHYNLGIAYKEMGLIDEAIGEFQVASKDPGKVIECCSMLGLCFLEKGMPQLAIKWYRKGLESPEITEEENLGLLYDLGTAHLESGDTAAAQKVFMEVYGINSNYRDIVGKIKQIEESKK